MAKVLQSRLPVAPVGSLEQLKIFCSILLCVMGTMAYLTMLLDVLRTAAALCEVKGDLQS